MNYVICVAILSKGVITALHHLQNRPSLLRYVPSLQILAALRELRSRYRSTPCQRQSQIQK